MVRGHAKAQAQERNAKKQESLNKPTSQLDARAAASKYVCLVCKTPATGYKQLVTHYESKHPKDTPPPE